MVLEELLAMSTRDYQHRFDERGASIARVKNNMPDMLEIVENDDGSVHILGTFKWTSEETAIKWLEDFADKHDLKMVAKPCAWQDGDYDNDWVQASMDVQLK